MNSIRNYLKIRKYFELNDKEKKTTTHQICGFWILAILTPGKVTQYLLHYKPLKCTSFGGTLFCLCAIFHNKEFHFVLFKKKEKNIEGFPGDLEVKVPYFHCKGQGFDPWSGN